VQSSERRHHYVPAHKRERGSLAWLHCGTNFKWRAMIVALGERFKFSRYATYDEATLRCAPILRWLRPASSRQRFISFGVGTIRTRSSGNASSRRDGGASHRHFYRTTP
jgi:hypothetical protein